MSSKSFCTSITCLAERDEKIRRSKSWKRTMGDHDVDGKGGEEDEGNDEIEGEVGEVT